MYITMRVDILNEKILKIVEGMVGHDETTFGSELEDVAYFLFKDKFRGVFAIDRMPKNMIVGQYVILNLDKRSEPGSHWIGAVLEDTNKLLIYDSFGRGAREIVPTMLNRYKIDITDPDLEQGELETNCGQRSIAFLYIYHAFGAKLARML